MVIPSLLSLSFLSFVCTRVATLSTILQVFFVFLNLFLAVLGLLCCARAFSSCGGWELLFAVVHGLLIAVASLVAEQRLQAPELQQLWHEGSVVVAHGLSCSGGMWDLPRPGLEPVSSALAGRFLTTAPPGESLYFSFAFLKYFKSLSLSN